MAERPIEIAPLSRDGVSQTGRRNAALDPGSVRLDDRTTRDLLVFVREHAKELVYYNSQNKPDGTWGPQGGAGGLAGFFRDLKDDMILSFLERPEDVDARWEEALHRPHFGLFLVWLKLLDNARDALNGLPRRHLDYTFREVLRLSPEPPAPDRVFVQLSLARGVESLVAPAGTRLSAGRDAKGRNRVYATERTLVVNRASVSRIASLFVDKRFIDLKSARAAKTGSDEDRFMAMLRLALGDPEPGDPLPNFSATLPRPLAQRRNDTVDFDRLKDFSKLIAFADSALRMQMYEFRNLIARKRARDRDDPEDWKRVNEYLVKAGRQKRDDPNWSFTPANPRDFNANLATALNGAPDIVKLGLPDVKTIDDLYVYRDREDVKTAIVESLHFVDVADFVAMMDLKRASDADWRVVNGLLKQAAGRVSPPRSPEFADPTNFHANLNAALGPIDFASVGVNNVDEYADADAAVERYASMPAEQFARVMKAASDGLVKVSEREWTAIDAILTEARRQKAFADGRSALRKIREAAKTESEGLCAILNAASGGTATAPGSAIEDVSAFTSEDDREILQDIADRMKAASKVTDAQWGQAYDILERAQRRRLQSPDPEPRRVEWLNLYAHADATTALADSGDGGGAKRWRTFGSALPNPRKDSPPAPLIGLAFASPVFELSSGARTITLTLAFYDDKGGKLLRSEENPFVVQVSTAEGWIALAATAVEDDDYAKLAGDQFKATLADLPKEGTKLIALQIGLTLTEEAPPIAPPRAADRFDACPWPVVRILLKPIWSAENGRFVIRYPRLRNLRLARAHLASTATSLGPLFVENDSGPLDGKKPFEPFGAAPAVGAAFAFGHPDLLRKPLRALTLHFDWMGGPKSLKDQYAAYGLQEPAIFKTAVTQVDNGFSVASLGSGKPLFQQDGDTQHAATPNAMALDAPNAARRPYDLPNGRPLDPLVTRWPRYLRLELTPLSFQHHEYPAVAAAKMRQLAADTANMIAKAPDAKPKLDPKDYAVGEPYTPKLKTFRLDFTAAQELLMDAYQRGPTSDQVFHIHPFGQVEAAASAPGQGFPFLPAYDNEGELYIGVADLAPPQSLALLFQMAEGSGDPDADLRPVAWSVLDADGWRPLSPEAILLDGTGGLIKAGVIELALPAARPDARLPGGLYWLRASVLSGAAGVCDTVGVHPQAVSAVFVDDGASPDHYGAPLPPQTIKAAEAATPGIGAVTQPYASFGGRPAETDDSFYTAVSERLRHKGRAVALWDYERLVLKRFPEVWKVKCLPPASRFAGAGGLGTVRMIVIPDIRGKSLFDPFEPKAPRGLLAGVAEYLRPLMPSTARLEVANAVFVQVRVRVGVRFADQTNPDYWRRRLNEDLNRYLAPWAYDDGADIVIGRRIYATSLVGYIDGRPYVDYVAGIKLFSSDDGGKRFRPAPQGDREGVHVSSDRADAVLVAAREHQIDLIADDDYKADQYKGVNYLKIELDFQVG